MDNLPDYINCQNTEIQLCNYLLLDICPSTCAYALEIGGVGVGAPIVPPSRTITKELIDKLFQEDMRNY